MSKGIKRIIGFLGILFSVGAVWYILSKYDFSHSWSIVKTTPPDMLVVMVFIYLSTFMLRALRWKYMLSNFQDITFLPLLKSIILGFAGNNLIPARGGEFLRMEYFSRKLNVSRTTSLSSIGLEKILDALVLLSFLLLASFWIKEANSFITNTIQIISFIFLPITAFLFILKLKGTHIIDWLEKRDSKLAQVFALQFSNFYAALSFLKADTDTVKIVAISISIWLLEGLVFILGVKSVGLNNSVILIGIIGLCIVNFGILIPSSPGYIGVFQVAVIIAFSAFGISEANSLASAIIIHSCQFFPITILGVMILLSEYFVLSKKRTYENTI